MLVLVLVLGGFGRAPTEEAGVVDAVAVPESEMGKD